MNYREIKEAIKNYQLSDTDKYAINAIVDLYLMSCAYKGKDPDGYSNDSANNYTAFSTICYGAQKFVDEYGKGRIPYTNNITTQIKKDICDLKNDESINITGIYDDGIISFLLKCQNDSVYYDLVISYLDTKHYTYKTDQDLHAVVFDIDILNK